MNQHPLIIADLNLVYIFKKLLGRMSQSSFVFKTNHGSSCNTFQNDFDIDVQTN